MKPGQGDPSCVQEAIGPNPVPSNPKCFCSRPDAPVLNVTYSDALAFARWAGKRLPSASEWDRAPHAGKAGITEWTSTPFDPSGADREAFRKLSGTDGRGEWFAVTGGAPLVGLLSDAVPGGIAIGFRCAKDAGM